MLTSTFVLQCSKTSNTLISKQWQPYPRSINKHYKPKYRQTIFSSSTFTRVMAYKCFLHCCSAPAAAGADDPRTCWALPLFRYNWCSTHVFSCGSKCELTIFRGGVNGQWWWRHCSAVKTLQIWSILVTPSTGEHVLNNSFVKLIPCNAHCLVDGTVNQG